MPSRRVIFTLLLLTLTLILIPSSVILAQDKALVWDRFDVSIKALSNGDMEIEESQAITFTSGSFHFGYRAIPLERVDSISNIRVFELQGDRLLEYVPSSSQSEHTFDSYREDNEQKIYWYFPYTEYSSHTYIIRYLVKGGLRIYEGGDQVWWKAIGADHNFPVTHSQVKVELPGNFTTEQITAEAYGTPADIKMPNGSTLVFTAGNIPAKEEFEVRAQFPHGAVKAAPPPWQAEDDHRREMQEKYGPVFDLGFLFMGIILLFGGPLAVYVLWYTRGRDEPAGLIADTISEPPGDLPPGVAGTLVDEQADLEDILATMIDLARRGAFHIEEENTPGFLGLGSGRDHIFHLKNAGIASTPYEKKLLRKIFGSQKTKRMSDLRQKFYAVVPELKRQLYDEVLQAGFFFANPQKTRQQYMGLGVAALILSGVFGFGMLAVTAEFSGMAICPTISLIISSISLLIVGRHMPKKTRQGAEEAAKWLAFKRYLKDVEKYGNLEEAKAQFDQYFPYAIAFGIERNLIRQFSKVETPAPTWYGPVWMGGMPHHPYGGGFPSTSSSSEGHASPGPLADGGTPTLSDMSRGMGTSLASMSAGLGSMLTSAGGTFTSRPSSSSSGSGGFSGGGFSGGGFSGGGGGGGGSSGFG